MGLFSALGEFTSSMVNIAVASARIVLAPVNKVAGDIADSLKEAVEDIEDLFDDE